MPKKTSAPSKTPSKTSFVLSLPATMSAKDVLSKGKALGLKLTEAYIYSIRSKAKGRVGKPAARRGRPPKAASATGSVSVATVSSGGGGGGGAERQFLNLALDLGLSRAEALLSNLRSKVKSAIA